MGEQTVKSGKKEDFVQVFAETMEKIGDKGKRLSMTIVVRYTCVTIETKSAAAI